MRIPISITCLLLTSLAFSLKAETRIFSSHDGRTLEAEIVTATKETVTLKRADGSTMTVAVGKFTQTDQNHIASWLQKQPKPSQHSFSVQFTKEKTGSSKMTSDTFEKWKCLLDITNRSGMTLENLTVDYEITVDEHPEFEADTPTKVHGSFLIPSIKQFAVFSEETSPFVLKVTQAIPSRSLTKTTSTRAYPRKRARFEQITLKIIKDGQTIFEWASGR